MAVLVLGTVPFSAVGAAAHRGVPVPDSRFVPLASSLPTHFWTRAIPTNVLASPGWPSAAAGEPEFAINRWGAMTASWEDQAVAGCPLGPVGMSSSLDSGASFTGTAAVGPYLGTDTSCANAQFEFDVAQTAASPNGTMWLSYGADPSPTAPDNTYTTVMWNNGTHLSQPVVSVPSATTGNNFLDRDWIMSTPNGTVVSVVDSCPGNVCPNIYESTAWNGFTFHPVVLLYSNGDTTASADALDNTHWLVGDQATPSQPGVCQLITTNDSGASWQAAASSPTGCGSITWQMVWGEGPAVDIVFLNSAATAVMFSQTFNWGKSWSTPVTLSGSPPSGTTFQTPTIATDPATGETAIFWLDTRANPSTAQWNVYERDSPDNGVSWSPLQQISSAVVGTGSGFWSGDWIWSKLTPWGTAGVVWGDNRTNTRLMTEFAQVPYENTNDGNLTVSVVDSSSHSVPNAFVDIGGRGGRTNSAGTVTFYNLVPGTIFCTGYKPLVGNGFANATVTKRTTSTVQIVLQGTSPPPPTATASAHPTSGHVPLTVNFFSNASGGTPGYAFAWRYGDGGSGATENSTHTYTSPGNYTAWLWVNDSNGASGTAQVSVAAWNPYVPLTVSANANPTSLALGYGVQLSSYPGGGTGNYVNYSWTNLPTGCATRWVASYICTPTAVGHWNATSTVTDDLGHSGSGSAEVDVWNSGSNSLSVSLSAAPRSFALGGTTTLTATAFGGSGTYSSYTWTGLPTGCGGASTSALTCTPSAAGHFNTTVTVRDSAGSTASSTTAVAVWPSSSAALSVSVSPPQLSLELGSSFTLSATPSGGTPPYGPYAWSSLPSGCSSGTTSTISCTPSGTGHFNASVSVVDSIGAHASATTEVDVWTPSSSSISVTVVPSPSSLGLGSTLTLSSTVQGGTGTYGTYAWTSLPSGCTSRNAASFSCVPTSPGHLNVTLTVTDSAGHTGVGHAEVNIYPVSSAGTTSSSGWFGLGTLGVLLLVLPAVALIAVVVVVIIHRRRSSVPPVMQYPPPP
ncbi:MAG: hypothetical protein KGJ23_12065 [Euryarchaeota archaeon]|nr:hypothetical protein [Euryarchaeota archaeon]MDE2045237.1 hypothetical protein [Thermoplasmata archaeon]